MSSQKQLVTTKADVPDDQLEMIDEIQETMNKDYQSPKICVVGLATQTTKFEPKMFSVDKALNYCVAGLHSDIIVMPQIPTSGAPTKAEIKFMERSFLHFAKNGFVKGATDGHAFKIWSPTTSQVRFLVDPEDPDNRGALDEMKKRSFRIILKTFEGEGQPYATDYERFGNENNESPDIATPEFATQYRKFHLPCGHTSKRRIRWSKVELWEDTVDPTDLNHLQHEYESLQSQLGPERTTDFRLYQAVIKMHIVEVNLQGLVSRMLDADNIFTANLVREIVNAFLFKEYNHDDRSVAVHGNKFYDQASDDTQSEKGFRRVRGYARDLGINAKGEIIMASRPVKNLFFPSDSKDTVATFLHEHHAAFKAAVLPYPETNALLRGKFVTTLAKPGEPKAISQVSGRFPDLTANAEHPEFPFLQLGAPSKNVQELPELCRFEPMQSHRTGGRGIVTEEVAKVEIPLSYEDSTVVFCKVNRIDKIQSDQHFQRIFDVSSDKPRLLFVEVSVELAGQARTDLSASSWISLRRSLCDSDRLGSDVVAAAKPLSLAYRPQDPTILSEWTNKLYEYVKTNTSSGRKAFVIAAIPGGLHNQHIYSLFKNVCDTAVGVQSFFVSAGSLAPKLSASEREGAAYREKAANNVLRRIRMRNPPMLAQEDLKGPQDLAVALHVSQISAKSLEKANEAEEKEQKGEDESKELLLVTVVVRSMTESKDYSTNVSLVSIEDDEALDPMKQIANVMEQLPKLQTGQQHRLTIFRSGFLSPAKSSEGDSKITDLYEKQVSQSDPVIKLKDREVYGKSTKASKIGTAKYELTSLAQHIRHVRQANDVDLSYLLVREDQGMIAPERNENAFTKLLEGEGAPGRSSQTLILGSHSHAGVDVAHRLTPTSKNKKITLTMVDLPVLAPAIAVPETKSANGAVKARPSQIDLGRLAKIFCDDYLGLYDTRWPVPTHLAHLATNRALCHIRNTANKVEAPSTAPYALREICSGVRDSLYYI